MNRAPDQGPEAPAREETWKELFRVIQAKGSQHLEFEIANLGKVKIDPESDYEGAGNEAKLATQWVLTLDVPQSSPLTTHWLGPVPEGHPLASSLGPGRVQTFNENGVAYGQPSQVPQKALEDIIATIQMS